MAEATELAPDRFLQLIADPRRWSLLQQLAHSDRRVGELTTLLGRPQNLVSYHLGALRTAGLVTSRRSSADGRDTYYRLQLARCRDHLATVGTGLHPGLRLTSPVATASSGRRRARHRALFLCTGNSARSQIAAALAAARSGGAIEARSAGSHPKPLHPEAVRVMAERGVDIAGRPSTPLAAVSGSHFDHVITLCDKVREVCPELPGRPATAHWSIPDPAADTVDQAAAFDRTAAEIEERVEFLVAQLAAMP